MSNLVKFSGSNLPPVSSLVATLRSMDVGATAGGNVGSVILKMDKTGHWCFGSDQTEIETDSTWAVNPYSFVHGYIAWGDGAVLGEKLVPITWPLPELPPAPSGAAKGWEQQVGMGVKCLTGADEGVDARFTTTSVGGKKFVQALAVLIATQVEADQTKPVPVILLKKDHYQHKSYGRIFTPAFELVKFISMTGGGDDSDAPEEAPAVTARRRRTM